MKSLFPALDLALILLACTNTVMATELYKIVQALKKSVSSGTRSKLRVAIIGGGYSGLACGHFCSKVADTVNIFGLEDSPGQQKGTSASTISVSL
jgi:predicted NAD/FAD-binding protein